MLNLFKNKKRVILDTNMFLLPGQSGIDIFTQIDKAMSDSYEFCIIEDSFNELKKIIEGKPKKKKDKFNAKLGLIMAKQKDLKVLSNLSKEASVDDSIIHYSNKDTFIASLDKELQKKVTEKGAKLLLLRQQKYFVVK